MSLRFASGVTMFGVVCGGLLLFGSVSGCSADASPSDHNGAAHANASPLESNGVAQDALSLFATCAGATGRVCAATQVCVSLRCPDANTTGVCVPRPQSCLARSSPVCGCNGLTYSNICQALVAGTWVSQLGACPIQQDPCARVACKTGEKCVAQTDGTPSCVPDRCNGLACKPGEQCVTLPDGTAGCSADPCARVTCKTGQHCAVGTDAGVVCVPDA